MVNVLGCPRCGDQTLWSHNQGRAWCRLCGHTWQLSVEEGDVAVDGAKSLGNDPPHTTERKR